MYRESSRLWLPALRYSDHCVWWEKSHHFAILTSSQGSKRLPVEKPPPDSETLENASNVHLSSSARSQAFGNDYQSGAASTGYSLTQTWFIETPPCIPGWAFILYIAEYNSSFWSDSLVSGITHAPPCLSWVVQEFKPEALWMLAKHSTNPTPSLTLKMF